MAARNPAALAHALALQLQPQMQILAQRPAPKLAHGKSLLGVQLPGLTQT